MYYQENTHTNTPGSMALPLTQCLSTEVKPSHWEHHSFQTEKQRLSSLCLAPSLCTTYIYTDKQTETFPHKVIRIKWFEEGMFSSLPVNDNMACWPLRNTESDTQRLFFSAPSLSLFLSSTLYMTLSLPVVSVPDSSQSLPPHLPRNLLTRWNFNDSLEEIGLLQWQIYWTIITTTGCKKEKLSGFGVFLCVCVWRHFVLFIRSNSARFV